MGTGVAAQSKAQKANNYRSPHFRRLEFDATGLEDTTAVVFEALSLLAYGFAGGSSALLRRRQNLVDEEVLDEE